MGAQTYPEYLTVNSDSYENGTFLTETSFCMQIENPISGKWFAAAYLNESKRDTAVTKVWSYFS